MCPRNLREESVPRDQGTLMGVAEATMTLIWEKNPLPVGVLPARTSP